MSTCNIHKWTSSNGNKNFCFSERDVFEKPWIIVIFIIILILGSFIEYIIYDSCYSLIPNFILFLFVFFWWLSIPAKANKTIIEKTTHEMMDDIVCADAKTAATQVAKSFVYYDTKGTYGIITGMCLLVLLKNGIVWEYPITYHKSNTYGFYS